MGARAVVRELVVGDYEGISCPTWTRKALWQAVENDRERRCSSEEFAANLVAHREALRNGVKWYKQSNSESRKKITDRAVKPKADFVVRMSKLMDLDEVQCEAILETCIKDDIEAPAVRRHIDWSQLKEIDYDDERLVVAVQQQYLNEREETLLTMAAIIRAADDEDHQFHHIIREFVRSTFDTEGSGQRLHHQLKTAIEGRIPPDVAADTVWASTWAMQYVKEQRLILQIIFLVYYTVTPFQPADASALICTIVEDFDFGRNQSNESLLDEESSTMSKHVSDLCVMVAIQVVRVTKFQENEDTLPTSEGEKAMKEIHLAMDRRALASSGRGDPVGPVLLAWGLLVQQLYSAEIEGYEDYADAEHFTEASNTAKNSWKNPQIMIQQAYMYYEAVAYLVVALQGPMVVDEHVALGYKSLIKDLITRLQSTVQNASSLPGREDLVECMTLVFANEEQLSLEWWEYDYSIRERRSLLDAARTAFPVDFVSLIRLLASLTSSAQTATYVFRYFKSLSTLADHFRPYDYVEDPFAQSEIGTSIYRCKGNSQGIVYGARDIYLEPPTGTVGQQINFDPPILLLSFQYSGWHLLLSILDSFLHGAGTIIGQQLDQCTSGTPETVSEILNLFNTFLEHADEALLAEFIAHISGVTTKSPTWKEKTAEHFVGLICQVLNRACTLSAPPIKLLTSCMTCLAKLLPYFPDAVWKNLRVDGLFPRHSSSVRLTPTNSYMEEVLLPAEIAAGRYPTTMAFLDLVSALIKDAQTLRPQDSPLTPEEEALETDFWEARRSSRLMDAFAQRVGGVENRILLERKFIGHAKSKEASILRSEVLFAAVIYIHSQVFPKHGTWRYAYVEHKFQLGLRVLQIFNQIMADSTWAHPDRPHKASALVDFSAVQEYLARSYLVDGSLYQLTPLLDTVGIGNDCPLTFYRNLQVQSARTTEECIEHALKFIKYLLKRRKIGGMKMSLLEYALLDRTVHNSSQEDAVELVQVVGRYIAYENYRPIPMLATEVLTLLCAVAADWKPRPPSFAGYLGLDVYQFVASIVRLLRDDRPSATAHEELQTALYNLVTIVIATQPGLGAMLLTGEASRPTLPKSVVELLASTAEQPTKEGELSNLSVLVPALALLAKWKDTLDSKPTTLPAAMRVLDALWQNAPQYMIILDKLRARPEFWNHLDQVFADDPVVPSEEPFVGCEEHTYSEDHDEVRRFCYSKLVRTYALRILAFEVYFTRGGNENRAVVSVAKRIFEAKNAEQDGGGVVLFTDNSTLPYRSDLATELLQIGTALNIPVTLSAYKLLTWSDDLDADAQFGDNFMYDLDLLRAKLHTHIQYRADDHDEEVYADFLSRLCAINHNRSMTDAHFSMVRAWKQFVKVLATIQLADHAVAEQQGGVKFAITADHAYRMMRGLTDRVGDEHRPDLMVVKYRSELCNLLPFLMATWEDLTLSTTGISSEAGPEETAQRAAELVEHFHRCMSTEHYELGPAGVFSQFPFHIELLAAIGFGLRVLRANATEATTRNAEMRHTLQKLLPAVCKGLALMLKGLGSGLAMQLDGHDDNNDADKQHRRQINIAMSCLIQLVSFSEMMDPATTIAIMDRHDLVPCLVVTFQKAVSGTYQTWPAFAEDVMAVLLTIAETPLGAERLAVEHALVCFANNSLTPVLSEGGVVPYGNPRFPPPQQHQPISTATMSHAHHRRSPWHRVWCGMIAVSTQLVQFLGSSAPLVDEATGFVRVYQHQITRAIDVGQDPDVTVGRLEEMKNVTELFYAVAAWADRARARAREGGSKEGDKEGEGRERECPDYSVLEPYADYALQMVAHFAYLFENPNEMHARIVVPGAARASEAAIDANSTATTTATQVGLKTPYCNSTNTNASNYNSSTMEQSVMGATAAATATRTHWEAAKGMLGVVRNVLQYLRLATDADRMVVGECEGSEIQPQGQEQQQHHQQQQQGQQMLLFQPTMAVHGGQAATMGTLFGLVRRMAGLVTAAAAASHTSTTSNTSPTSPTSSQHSTDIEHTLTHAATHLTPPTDLLLITEHALILAVTQLVMYRRAVGEGDEVGKEMVGEVEGVVRAVEAALTRGQKENAGRARKEGEKLLAVLKVLDMFRAAEFGR
ncbi:hypothetical protein PhCBS80983_g01289 [Powellomyces hirtus]|uniref:Nucleoporin NUP188 n=1 Tax=Powellomyces hirtus TaxID=109895 RepID=A0A507EDA3_9FUNG|nr:hypothetical protein PhCBS80983_g01289 [Powellomyces hirtus]